MSKQDCIKMDGTVIADKSNSIFDVEWDNNSSMVIRCTLAGKIRMNNIRIMCGDRVSIEVSPYDVTKGRICYRYKTEPNKEN